MGNESGMSSEAQELLVEGQQVEGNACCTLVQGIPLNSSVSKEL